MFEPLDNLRPKYGASLQSLYFDSLAKCKEMIVYIIARFIALGKKKEFVSLKKKRN